jgi:hypothetical protein
MSDGKEAMRMEPIYPPTEEHLDRFRGQLVCVVMRDGTRHVGILSRCRGGRLILNEDAGDHGDIAELQAEAGEKRRTRRRSGSRKRSGKAAGAAQPDTADAAGFGSGGWAGPPYAGPWSGGYRPPYGFFGPRLLLDLALVALVFLIL